MKKLCRKCNIELRNLVDNIHKEDLEKATWYLQKLIYGV
jgi:hypothetical protein